MGVYETGIVHNKIRQKIKGIRSYRSIIFAKSFNTLTAFYALMFRVFQRLLANMVDLKKCYISSNHFKTVL